MKSFARETFYADCDEATASAAIASLTWQSQAVLGFPNTRAAWRSIPSTYVVLTQDRVIPEFMQRDFAAQAGTVREMATSHSPMLSQPESLAALLEEIAAASVPMRRAS